MAPGIISPVPGNIHSALYKNLPGGSRQTSGMSTFNETEIFSLSGFSQRRESGMIRKLHSSNPAVNSLAQRFQSNGGAQIGSPVFPLMTDAQSIREWISNERMIYLPPEGSSSDKVLSWAQLFVWRLNEFDVAIRDDSGAAATISYMCVGELLRLSKENEDNAEALMTSFGFFYSLSASLLNLLERTELFDVSADVRRHLVSALLALVDLVDVVTKRFQSHIRAGKEAITIELYEYCSDQITSFRESCDYIAEAMWKHQLSRESFGSVSDSDIKKIRFWLAPEDSVLSRVAENTSHFAHEREEMTCRWVGPSLSDFLKSPQRTLSIFGRPGSGKTILASVIVDSLSDQTNDYMTLFVPINACIPAATTLTSIAKTILFQLFEKRIGNVRLLEILDAAYKESYSIVDVTKYEDILWGAVKRALAAALPKAKELVVVVDGLDEASCSEQALFKRLTAAVHSAPNVRLITLGTEKHVDTESEEITSMSVSQNRIFEDISVVVRKMFTNPKAAWFEIFNTISSELEQEIIIDKITEASQGSFLWAKLATKQACLQTTPEAMRERIETLVEHRPSVSDFVAHTLSTSSVSEEAKYMLLWLATAERPLTLKELSALASVQVDRQTVTDPIAMNSRRVLQPVTSLVFLDNGQVYLRHGLIRNAILDIASKGKLVPVKDRHQDFTTRLLVYINSTVTGEHDLSLGPLSSYETLALVSKNHLLEFAVRYWPFHLQQTTVYTTGGDVPTSKEFTRLLPASTTILLLQTALWENQSTPTRCSLQNTVTGLIRQNFTYQSPVTLQSILNLAKFYHDIGQTPKATYLMYEVTEFSLELLDDKKLVTQEIAVLFLELTGKPENVTSLKNISRKREKMFRLLISCYVNHYGTYSDLVIKTYHALIGHYQHTREESKIEDVKLEIRKITGHYYDQSGSYDELRIVLRPGEQPTDPFHSAFNLNIWQDQTKDEAKGAFDFHALLQKAEQYIQEKHFSKAEHIYVQAWQHASRKWLTQYSEYWEQIRLRATVVYSRFLQSQDRKKESSAILNSAWEEYRYKSVFVSESTSSFFREIAELMESVELFTAALNIFKQVKQVSSHSQSTVSEIEKHIQRTHQKIVHQARSSSSTVSEVTLIEIIYDCSQTGVEVDESMFDALIKKVKQHTKEYRWKDSTRLVKKILRKLWPSLFSSSVNDVTLPKDYTDRCVYLAGLLGDCYHYRRRFTREEGIRFRVYRALRVARPVDDQKRINATEALIKFFRRSSQPDRVISIKQEVLFDVESHYTRENPWVIELLRELAELARPRPVFVDYHIRIIEILNKDQPHCHPGAIDNLIIVVDELWRQSRYTDVRHWHSLLFKTFLKDPKQHEKLQDPVYVHTFFLRYTECLRKVQVEYDTILKVTKQYYDKVQEFFVATVSITVKATLMLAMVYQETKVNRPLALGLYESLLDIQSNEIEYNDIKATIHGLREEEDAAALQSPSSASSEQIRKTTVIQKERFEKFVETYTWSSHETLSKLEEMVSFWAKHEESSETLYQELQESTFQILSTELSSTQLLSAATVIANGYLSTKESSQAYELASEIYHQVIMKSKSHSATHKLDLTLGRQSLVFLAQLEHTLRASRTSTVAEILASLTDEYLYFEEFRNLTSSSSKSVSFSSVSQTVSNLYTLLRDNKRDQKIVDSVYDDYVAFFLETEGQRIQLTDTAQVQTLLSTILRYLSEHESDNFLRSVGVASYHGIDDYLIKKDYESASNLALAAFRCLSVDSDELHTEDRVKYIVNMGLLITGHTQASEIDQAAAQKQLSHDSGLLIIEAVRVLRGLNVDISQIGLDNLNLLIGVLGQQKQYDGLLWILSGLWQNRKKHAAWPASVTLQLARQYILARYLTSDGLKASRLAEDILYNCRRVNGPAHPSTLEMSILVSQLYTGVADRLQRSNGGQHMAQRLYKRVAGVHEHLLRVFLDPNLVDLDSSLESSLDGSYYDLDLNDSTVDVNQSDKEHLQQHLQFMKLAIQRLGDWPQDSREYKKLDERLFQFFESDLEGVDHIDTWDLKSYGSGKASASNDILDPEAVSWGLILPTSQGFE
ncbi:hypothetical protein N7532_002985 [Penicillium argentinense]|uniref:Nephrocystin 3-like N-terminal domain-containing protein n=1 Tax=Penicillium argentinense TaxID=1131581 RepID=A0A9W9FLM0_9EURO|nr:uncharacterized protein N7532_002985 [Penicillium argentinense]KAJ5102456.1 hypothetical protein N7532_002985 [Penicillium argentinense]